jgi:uncharacterized protein YjbI with pentapeptide repeats
MADPRSEDIAEVESQAKPASRIDKLQAAADEAAGEVRNLYIAFLSFGLYLAVTVGATTDEQLLRASPVRLPIVDVGLPLVAFYWIAPLLFVLFHFNLLMQLYLLSEKLHRLDLAIGQLPADEQHERRATFSQFVFSQMVLGGHRSRLIRMLLQAIGWTTLVVLPIAVLMLTQIQFLPYHGAFTTWWHRFLIVLDLLLLWLLWLQAIDPRGQLGYRLRLAWPVIGLLSLSAVSLLMAFLVATIPGSFLGWPIDSFTEHGNIGLLNRNLALREAQLVLERPPPGLAEDIGEEAAFENYTRGLDLRGRDLRNADLVDADLSKADLRDRANLQGANLSRADLQGANLSRADLQGARLSDADLQGADLLEAKLQAAYLLRANLQGAYLSGANLQGANLREAKLQGADLANFWETDLQAAYLREDQLVDLILFLAHFRGAYLRAANLQGAYLVGANLQGAYLLRANLQGADLSGAKLQGANLREAKLQGANLREANLQGAYLGGANLQGADLRDVLLWRAFIGDGPDRDDLWHLTDLRGAEVDPVDLNTLIAETEDQIADEGTRTQVIEGLESALRDDDRPELPSWQGQPNVMFEESDPIRRALGWSAPTTTEVDYDEKLAAFLGDLACGDDEVDAIALGIAVGRAVNEENRLLSQLVAQRLMSDEPEPCPAAAALPEYLRAQLEEIADRPEWPPSDQAEPEAASPGAPLQEPQPSVPAP